MAIQEKFRYLVEDLKASRPVQTSWPNYVNFQ